MDNTHKIQLLKINIGKTITATPVDHIENGKPAVFVFEGIKKPYDPFYEDRKDNQYLVKLAHNQCANAKQANFYTIETEYYCYNPFTTPDYNDDPHTATTPVSQHVVRNIMLPNLPDISHVQGAERTNAINETKKRLSRQIALGYSLGGALIQELPNVLHDYLKQKGFTQDETRDCMALFSAATLGCTAKLIPKQCNITQLHTFVAGDERVTKLSPENLDVSKDPHPHSHINGQQKGENNLAIVSVPLSLEGEKKPHTYATRLARRQPTSPRDAITPEERITIEPAMIANCLHNPTKPAWIIQPVMRQADSRHDLFLCANVDTSLRTDLQIHGFNPGANIYWETVNRFVTSAAIGYGNNGYQSPPDIIRQVQQEFLSPEGKETAMRNVEKSVQNFRTELKRGSVHQ